MDEHSVTSTDGSTSVTYVIMLALLEEDSLYTITVRAINGAGSSEVSDADTGMTLEEGERHNIVTNAGYVVLKCPLPPTPSAAPESVTVTGVTSSTVTVQWGMVPCIHWNGEITGYSVRYSGGGSTQTVSVVEMEVTIQDLMPSTDYFIEVAAVHNAGIGPYSDPIAVDTMQSE